MSLRRGLPLTASILGHGCILVLLILMLGRTPLPMLLVPPQKQGIEVMLAPAEPIPPPQPPAPPPPPTVAPPPPIPPPIVEQKPPPPEPPPPPARRAIVRVPPRRPPPRQPRREMVEPRYEPPQPVYQPPQPEYRPPQPVYQAMPQMPPQVAAIPRPVAPPRPPGPLISGAYRNELSAWLASHKRYPESARERGEEGGATLRFRVDRSGRVLGYSLVSSTGYPDLDAAIDEMMRGAVLPPFPPDMTANDVEVTVPIHFRLER